MSLIKKSKDEGKQAILYAPELNSKTVPSLEKTFPGLKVITSLKELGSVVTGVENKTSSILGVPLGEAASKK